MQSIPFNYISYFSFQIKNSKGKTDRLKLRVFDAFGGGYFLFVFLFLKRFCTLRGGRFRCSKFFHF